jgi:hypothetical protein
VLLVDDAASRQLVIGGACGVNAELWRAVAVFPPPDLELLGDLFGQLGRARTEGMHT